MFMQVSQGNLSKTATADDQVIPLPKQMNHPQTSLPMQKKDRPCPFIVRRGWCIKGQECDFSHADLLNNLDLRKPVKTRKVRGPNASFLGEPETKQYYIPHESARNELAGNRKHPNEHYTNHIPPSTTAT